MKNLSTRLTALAAVAILALLGLTVLSVIQSRYDLLLIGLVGVVGVGVGLTIRQAQLVQAAQLKRLVAQVDQLGELAKGIKRLEELHTGSPRLLDGSQERQVAETAARFDWLARRHREQAEHLDAFLTGLQATIAEQHQDVVAQLRSTGSPSVRAPGPADDGEGTVGSSS